MLAIHSCESSSQSQQANQNKSTFIALNLHQKTFPFYLIFEISLHKRRKWMIYLLWLETMTLQETLEFEDTFRRSWWGTPSCLAWPNKTSWACSLRLSNTSTHIWERCSTNVLRKSRFKRKEQRIVCCSVCFPFEDCNWTTY